MKLRINKQCIISFIYEYHWQIGCESILEFDNPGSIPDVGRAPSQSAAASWAVCNYARACSPKNCGFL